MENNKRIYKLITFVLVIVAFGAGVYFRDDAIKFYNDLNKQIRDFQETEIGQIISQTGKQIFAPSPLNVGGNKNQIILLQSKIISETNRQRDENGDLPALVENLKLNEAAAVKANDMFANQYFEHVSPFGIDPGKLVQNSGYEYIIAGENLILGNFSSEQEVVQKWMDSPGHRANILNNRYTEIGVAVVRGTYNGEAVWIGVQEFGLPSSTCSYPDEVLKNQIDLEKQQLDFLALQIDERKEQINKVNSKSAVYGQMIDDYNQLVGQYNALAEVIKIEVADYNNQIVIFNNCVEGE